MKNCEPSSVNVKNNRLFKAFPRAWFYKTVTINVKRIKPGTPKNPMINAFRALRGRMTSPKTLKATIITAPNPDDISSRIYHLNLLFKSQQQRIIRIIPMIKAVMTSAYIIRYIYSNKYILMMDKQIILFHDRMRTASNRYNTDY